MEPWAGREQIRVQLQIVDAKIGTATATVAEISAQRGVTLKDMAMMEHMLAIIEALRTGYLDVIEAFEQDHPELARERLERVNAVSARLGQWLGTHDD